MTCFLPLISSSCDWILHRLQAGGVAVILGLMDSSKEISFHPSKLLWGKSWTSGLFGGFKGRSQLPDLVDKCVEGVQLLTSSKCGTYFLWLYFRCHSLRTVKVLWVFKGENYVSCISYVGYLISGFCLS